MTDATNRRVEFGHADFYTFHRRKLQFDIRNEVVRNVFEQAGGPFHHRRRDLIQGFVIDCRTEPVTAGCFRKISEHSNIYGVFITNLLLLIVETVVGKKLEAF